MTRIISGRFRGKNIMAPRNLPVRPTTDFAKESLFNILNNHYFFEEVKVLDLFAGTGNISFEFVSRGCETITALDNNPHCIRFMEKMADQMDFSSLKIIRADALSYLKSEFLQYNIIFADPPYDFEEYAELTDLIFRQNLLHPEGMLIIEHSKYQHLDELPHFKKMRKYGKVCFSFFEMAPS